MPPLATSHIAQDILDLDLSQLCDHLVETHHVYIREHGPVILDLLAQVQAKYQQNTDIKKIQILFWHLYQDLLQHLPKEEHVLFPMAKQLLTGSMTLHCGPPSGPIGVMEYEHEKADNELKELRNITQNYQIPVDSDAVVQTLFNALKAFDADLVMHMNKENNLLFPAILKQGLKV